MSPTHESTPGSLTLDFDLAHSPQKVWRALTSPDLLAKWLLPTVGFELEPGTRFTFQTDPHPGWDGTVHCQMLEAEPHARLRYGWVVGDLDTVVTLTLTPTDSGTRLRIHQTGFTATQKKNLGGARYGWKMMGGRLVELLDELT